MCLPVCCPYSSTCTQQSQRPDFPENASKIPQKLKVPVIVFVYVETFCLIFAAMDMPAELTALNITPQGALLKWNPPLSSVDNYVLTLTHNQGKLSEHSLPVYQMMN